MVTSKVSTSEVKGEHAQLFHGYPVYLMHLAQPDPHPHIPLFE